MLSTAERDVRAVRLGDRPVPRSIVLDHAQRAVGEIGDPATGRIGTWVDHFAAYGHSAYLAADRVHRPQRAGQREGGQPPGFIDGIGDDPGPLLTRPLAASSLLHGEFLSPSREQCGRVRQQPLSTAGHVQRPQAGHRILAATAAQEQHGRSVSSDAELIRCAQAESTGTGELAGQRECGHAGHRDTCMSYGARQLRTSAGRGDTVRATSTAPR